nr:MAG TPA: hypothetical protein [Caudoviricetes sp.]
MVSNKHLLQSVTLCDTASDREHDAVTERNYG